MARSRPIDLIEACPLCYRVSRETKTGRRCRDCSGEFVTIVKRQPANTTSELLRSTLVRRMYDA